VKRFQGKTIALPMSLYQMFDYPVKWGKKQQFKTRMASYFPSSFNAFLAKRTRRKTLSVHFTRMARKPSRISRQGRLRKIPMRHLEFQALVPTAKCGLGMDHPGDWSPKLNHTFLEATSEAALQPINRKVRNSWIVYAANTRRQDVASTTAAKKQ